MPPRRYKTAKGSLKGFQAAFTRQNGFRLPENLNIRFHPVAFGFHPAAAGGGFAFTHQAGEGGERGFTIVLGNAHAQQAADVGFMVVSLSWSGFISPRPLKRLME